MRRGMIEAFGVIAMCGIVQCAVALDDAVFRHAQVAIDEGKYDEALQMYTDFRSKRGGNYTARWQVDYHMG